ncbi:MAG: IclR family transcriptional regulator [Ruminococcaceae bacterium]|jgi:DNA-binding IclR family transcriptional regulator|nr:IclR family transcriptional regulator [Oscillospiraceae bacterium]
MQMHRSTQRVIDILDLLAYHERADGLSLTDIAGRLDAPKSSLFPILRTLAGAGYLRYDATTSKYTIGRRLFEVGNSFVAKDNFYQQALVIMQGIVDQCSETCHMANLYGSEVQYMLKIDSPETIRMTSAPGKRLPANCTALGKALLSEASCAELQALFSGGLPRMTDKTITDMGELYRQLQGVRKTGLAYEQEENYSMIQCIATPIMKGGKPVVALSVSMPTFRAAPEKQALIEQLLLSAKKQMELIL